MFPFRKPLWLIECLYNFLRSIVIDMLVFRAVLGPEVPEKRGGGNKFLTIFFGGYGSDDVQRRYVS